MISGSSKARLGYMCPVDGLRQPRPPPRGNCPGRRPQAPACFKYLFGAIFKLTNEHRLQYICYSPTNLCRPCCSSSPVCKGAGPSLDKIHRIDLRPCQLFYSIVATIPRLIIDPCKILILQISEFLFRASATEELDSNFLAFGSLDHLGEWKSNIVSKLFVSVLSPSKPFHSKKPVLSFTL